MQTTNTIATSSQDALELEPPDIDGAAIVSMEADTERGRLADEVVGLGAEPVVVRGYDLGGVVRFGEAAEEKGGEEPQHVV